MKLFHPAVMDMAQCWYSEYVVEVFLPLSMQAMHRDRCQFPFRRCMCVTALNCLTHISNLHQYIPALIPVWHRDANEKLL